MTDNDKSVPLVTDSPQPLVPVSPLRRLLIGIALLTVVFATLGLYQIQQTRVQSLHQAEIRGMALAEVLRKSLVELFHKTDLTVQTVIDEIVRQSDSGGIREQELRILIERQFQRLPELDALRVSDANGNISIGSGRVAAVQHSIADRSYFSYLRDNPDSAMVISNPLIGKTNKKWVLTCARRITLSNGAFGGVVFGAITIDHLNDLLQQAPVGRHGSVSIRRDDLTLITRYSADHQLKNEQAPGTSNISAGWQKQLAQGKRESGTYADESATDAIWRIYNYARISPYPLYVNVGLAMDEVLAEFAVEQNAFLGFMALFLFMSGLLVWQVQRNWQKNVVAFAQFAKITELEIKTNQQNEQLLANRELLRNMIDITPSLIYATDKEGHFIVANKPLALLFGMESEQMVGKLRDEFMPAEIAAAHRANELKVLQGGIVEQFEESNVELDGTHTYLTTKVPLRNPQGEIVGVCGISTDISERKIQEFQRERLLSMLEATRNELHVFDPATLRYVYANKCSLDNLGYTLEQFCQLTPFDLVQDLTPESFAELIVPLRNGDCQVIKVETTHRRADGSTYPVETHLQHVEARSSSSSSSSFYLAVVFDISERKQANERLARMSHEWQTTFDAISDSVLLIDAEQRIIRCNKATATLCDRDFRDIIGRNCWEVVHGSSEPLAECPMTRSLQTGKTETMTFQRGGSWLDVIVDPIVADDGTISGAVQVVRDVTDTKILAQTQLFLLQCGNPGQEEFFTALARYLGDTLDMFFVCIDRLLGDGLTAETVAVYVDGHFEDNVSYALKDTPCGDVVGKTICCFPRDVRGLFPKDDVLQDMMAESYVGTTLWSSHGEPIGLIAIIGRQSLHNTDLAEAVLKLVSIRAAGELERRQAEKLLAEESAQRLLLVDELKKSADLFALFMKYSPIYTFIKEMTDSESRVLQASDNFVEMIGIPAAEMIGKTMHQLFPAEFVDKITMDDRMVVASGQFVRLEEELNGKYFITYKFPIVGDDGKQLLAGYTIDITDQKQAQNNLVQMQAQVIQQEKLATLGQLAAGVAHEINNPVGFIKSNLVSLEKYTRKIFDYLTKEKEAADRYLPKTEHEELANLWRSAKLDFITDDVADLLQESIEGTERIRRIVQDLVSFARQEGAELVPVDLNKCLEQTIPLAWNEIKHQAELRTDLADVAPVLANSQKLSQVFLNLLMNASHAVAKGGVISLRTWQENESAYISIADNGCGIPPEIREKIFEPFFTTKEIGKGTGLGLAISQDLITKFGGTITLESEVGIGTTFTIRLPVVPV